METITETIITESTMIGHNPKTPGGVGLGVGVTITPEDLLSRPADTPYILVVSSAFDFADVATMINASVRAGYQLTGVILQQDDGVLVSNRLAHPCPSSMKSFISTVSRWGCWLPLRSPYQERSLKPFLTPTALQLSLASMPMRLKHCSDGTGADRQPFSRGGENAVR